MRETLGSAAVDSFDEADVALYIESAPVKFRDYPRRLLATEPVQRDPGRCFTFDFSDWPTPFLPGLYVSLSRSRFDERRTRAVTYWLGPPDPRLEPAGDEPRLLASFRGAASSELRERLFGQDLGPRVSITRTEWRWGSARDPAEREAYARELQDSAFVLCPRGNATTTLRLFETMQAGRVPVVIADDWVAPRMIAWDDLALQVREADVPRLPEILERAEPMAVSMGRRAREEWEQWCRPGEPALRQFLGELSALVAGRPDVDPGEWTSHRFLWRYGLHPVQGVRRRVSRARRPRPRGARRTSRPS
jgi:hypothetical protein